ncbi:MAG: hypothetical protein E6G56_14525 [Actinobacteria bacterium]|nr:MAG: hypothetical protein E6G56_14525 [Actinomycetota bacterium]
MSAAALGDPLARVAQALRAEGGLLANAVRTPARGVAGPGLVAGGGPRASGRGPEYAALVEAMYEGYLAHYDVPRLLDTADRDLALLAGDRLYAMGLGWLVELSDLEAVIELAETISLAASARARGLVELAEAAWAAGAVAVGFGATAEHRAAKQAAREGNAGAESLLRAAARRPAP